MNAMREEMQSLEENETFSLTRLPPGKQTVGAGPDAACFDQGGNEHFWGGGIITERDRILFYIDTIFETA